MSNRFIAVQPGTDPNQQLAIINKNFAELDNESVKKLFYDNNGVPSIQIGVQQDGTSRIRVAKAGVDVTTATDAQLAFNSSQNTLKVASSSTVTLPACASGAIQSITVNHNLGYTPIIIAFELVSGVYNSLPATNIVSGGANDGKFATQVAFAVDSSVITFTVINSSASSGTSAIPVKYYLLQESAA